MKQGVRKKWDDMHAQYVRAWEVSAKMGAIEAEAWKMFAEDKYKWRLDPIPPANTWNTPDRAYAISVDDYFSIVSMQEDFLAGARKLIAFLAPWHVWHGEDNMRRWLTSSAFHTHVSDGTLLPTLPHCALGPLGLIGKDAVRKLLRVSPKAREVLLTG